MKRVKKIIGIYKITSPSGRIYIGQSTDINDRFRKYKRLAKCTETQTLLYRSIVKHGCKSHAFEILKRCPVKKLNYWEAFFISKFNSFESAHGMNLTSGGDKYRASKETRLKISEANKRRSPETIKKIAEAKIGNKHMLGKSHTEATKNRISVSKTGSKLSSETIAKMRLARSGFKHSDKSKALMSLRCSRRRKVVDIATNKIFDTVKDAAQSVGLKSTTLIAMLKGQNPNKTTLSYV